MTAIPDEAVALPCPFCGGEAVVRRSMQEYPADGVHPAGEYEAWVNLVCDTCGIEMGDEYRADAIAAWNRRAAPLSPVTEYQAAYGLLWRMRTTDKAIHEARRSLLAQIGKAGQRTGLEWALRTFGPRDEPTLEELP